MSALPLTRLKFWLATIHPNKLVQILCAKRAGYSQTDMWRATGADPQQAPAKWRALPATKAFVEAVSVTIGFSDSELLKVKNGGRDPGTSAHWQVGLAYAKYLNPEFRMWCNTVVRERMGGQITFARSASFF